MIPAIANDSIRTLDTRKDLLQVADLIETCFSPHLDSDGYLYLQQIRRAAQDNRQVRWTYAAGEMVSYPLNGFVCEADGQVVGNLSLIPFYWKRRWIYLIANVAVHPDYRRMGIAKALTRKALDHLRRLPITSVWLHVREDNLAARHLYESFHFHMRSTRDTWVSQDPFPSNWNPHPDVKIEPRRNQDWPQQQKWLNSLYPPDVAWHLALDIPSYKPGIFATIRHYFNGKQSEQWAARIQGKLAGVATLDKSFSYADPVFLALPPGMEEKILPVLLPHAKIMGSPNRPITVNFPAYQARSAFEDSGFELINTLIWMEIRVN